MFELVFNECDFFQIKYGVIDIIIFNHPLRKTYFENKLDYLKPYEKAFVAFEINYN